MKARMASRVAAIYAAIISGLQQLPEQPMREQLLLLAQKGEQEADSLLGALRSEERTPVRSAA